MTRLMLMCALLLALTANAAPLDYYLPEGTALDGSVPTPDEVIEHEVGEWHVTHDKLVYYMRALASASPRASIETARSCYLPSHIPTTRPG